MNFLIKGAICANCGDAIQLPAPNQAVRIINQPALICVTCAGLKYGEASTCEVGKSFREGAL